MRRALLVLLLAIPASGAAADLLPPRLPAPYTCEDVRAYVGQYGKIVAWTWAKLNGYTAVQIVEARKCLRRP